MQLLLGEKLVREHPSRHTLMSCSLSYCLYDPFDLRKFYFVRVCSYFLVPEGLHQPDRLLHREGEGEVRSRVDLRHLNVLVAEIPLPLRVPTNLILSEDVRDQIS